MVTYIMTKVQAKSDLVEFAARVRSRRKAIGATQGEIARLVGRDQTFVSNVERATTHPSLDAILNLAAALDVKLMLVPRQNVAEVERLLGRPEAGIQPPPSAFEEVFVPDPEEGDDHER
jgi:transcriptional regulator with XRE-family HTH domain